MNQKSRDRDSRKLSTIFWKEDFSGEATGGYYFRAFELKKFFNRLKDAGKRWLL